MASHELMNVANKIKINAIGKFAFFIINLCKFYLCKPQNQYMCHCVSIQNCLLFFKNLYHMGQILLTLRTAEEEVTKTLNLKNFLVRNNKYFSPWF